MAPLWDFCLRALIVTACVWAICWFPLSWGLGGALYGERAAAGLGGALYGSARADQGLAGALYGVDHPDQGLAGALGEALYGSDRAAQGLGGALYGDYHEEGLAGALTRVFEHTWLGRPRTRTRPNPTRPNSTTACTTARPNITTARPSTHRPPRTAAKMNICGLKFAFPFKIPAVGATTSTYGFRTSTERDVN